MVFGSAGAGGERVPGRDAADHVDPGRTLFEVRLHVSDMRRPLRGHELSDGTLRLLCLLAALLTPRPAELLVLDESETSLHPQLLPVLCLPRREPHWLAL